MHAEWSPILRTCKHKCVFFRDQLFWLVKENQKEQPFWSQPKTSIWVCRFLRGPFVGLVTKETEGKLRLGEYPTLCIQNPAPPQKPNDVSLLTSNKHWFVMVPKWCRISSIHSRLNSNALCFFDKYPPKLLVDIVQTRTHLAHYFRFPATRSSSSALLPFFGGRVPLLK